MGLLNKLITPIISQLDFLLKPLVLIAEILVPIVNILFKLNPIMIQLNAAVSVLTFVIDKVTKGIAVVVNAIIRTINGFLGKLANALKKIPKIGSKIAKKLNDARLEEIDLSARDRPSDLDLNLDNVLEGVQFEVPEAFRDVEEESDELTSKLKDTSRTTKKFGDTVKDVNAELTNVPSGFKVALNRFQSAFGTGGGALRPAEGGLQPVTGAASPGGDIFVNVNDAREFATKLVEMEKFKNFEMKATSNKGGGQRFSVQRDGS